MKIGNFLFKIQDPEGTVKAAAETAMREVIAKSRLQPILTKGRSTIEIEVQEIIHLMQSAAVDWEQQKRRIDEQNAKDRMTLAKAQSRGSYRTGAN